MFGKRLKVIRQQDSTDCGPACVAMLLQYYNKPFSLTKLREDSGTDTRGSTMKGIFQALIRNQMDCKVLKIEDGQLDALANKKFIAHIESDNGGHHYVVVYNITKDHVKYVDPARGFISDSKEEFLEKWTRYILLTAPSAEFEGGEKKSNKILFKFIPLISLFKGNIFYILLASIILTIMGVASSFLFRILIDDVLFLKDPNYLISILIGIVGLSILQIVLSAVRSRISLSFSVKMNLVFVLKFLKHMFNLPLNYFASRRVGEVLARLDDTDEIQEALSSAVFTIFFDTLMVLFIGVALAIQNFQLFLFAALLVPISCIVVWAFAGKFRKYAIEEINKREDYNSLLIESVNGISTLKSNAAELKITNKLEKRLLDLTDVSLKSDLLEIIQDIFISFLNNIGGNMVFWFGCSLIISGDISLGSLFGFNALLGYFVGPLTNLLNLQPSLVEAHVAAKRVLEVLDLETENDRNDLIVPDSINKKIAFDNVDFRYGAHQLTLKNISFEMEPGSSLGIVGVSGSGKSTITKLLLKLYKPESGRISIGGLDLQDICSKTLRRKVGYVSQDVFLFNGTIKENITLGASEISTEKVLECAKMAGAHDFISKQVYRYDSLIFENGSGLSGGEKQRLAIARALVSDPEILIFDEATSNLDIFSEKEILKTIEDLKERGITMIFIAHRLSTVTSCDQIIMLDEGQITNIGTHDDLIEKSAEYAEMWSAYVT